jgi:gliding motility-associated-like protein
MTKVFTPSYKNLFTALLLLCGFMLRAQTYTDGAMQIDMMVGYSYIESVDDPIFGELNNDEFRFRWWGADNANVDGVGFTGGAVISASSGSAGWVTGQDYSVFSHLYGPVGSAPITVPQYLQLQGETWEDDCYDCYRSTGTFIWEYECDQCSSTVYDGGCGCSGNILCGCSAEDQHCGPTVLNSQINYRIVAPCLGLFSPSSPGSGYVSDYFSTGCGGDDMGAEIIARWTPPIPNPIAATAIVLCDPGLVTLSTGGAVFGGDYRWYNDANNLVVGTGSQITPFVSAPTTFRVHTVNGPCESLSYRLITITVGSPSITSVTKTNPACNGASTGSINITASGGTGALQYSIDNGTTWLPSGVFNNLPAGIYFVKVKDANNCEKSYISNPVILTEPPAVNIYVNKVDVTCNGASTGRIEVYAGGGTGALQFSVNNGGTFQTNPVFNGLAAGAYTVVVQDGSGCVYPYLGNPVNISQPPVLTATTTIVDASCATTNNGTVTVNATGGTPPYSYSLNNGPYFPNPTFTGLPAGNYNALVADNFGCQFNIAAVVGNAYTLNSTILSQTDVSCSGGADGTVTVTQTGGVGPFQFSINNGTTWQTDSTFTNLSGGTYTILVRDFNTCTDNVNVVIVERPPLYVLITSSTNVNCFGDSTGGFTTISGGGDSVYTYLWSNGSTAQNPTGMPAGPYSVTVTDGAGCTALATGIITQNSQMITQLENGVNVLCFGGTSGGLDITVNGGVYPYSFAWNNGATSEDIYNLPAGTYTVSVFDNLNCIVADSFTITEPGTAIAPFTSVINVTCPGGNDGVLMAAGSGGTPPYTYLWSNGAPIDTVYGVSAGGYLVTITDANGCTVVKTAAVFEPAPWSVADSINNVLCSYSSDGSVYINVSGATPPYTYNWSNGTGAQNLTGVTGGNYNVVITDSVNCTFTQSFTINSPTPLLSSVAGSDPDCYQNATGFAVVSPAGGTPPYSYAWSTTPNQSGIMAIHLLGNNLYYVTVSDNNGCQKLDSVILNEPAPIVVTPIPQNVTCFSGNNGSVTITASGGSGIYDYYLNGLYQTDSTYFNLLAGSYTIVVEDNNNCVGSSNITITEPQAFSVNAGPDMIIARSQPAQLNGTAQSANGILGYYWMGDTSNLSCTACPNPVATPDSTTTYVLMALDGDTCAAFDTVTVFVNNNFSYFIPTAFTPNSDGLNDYFEVNILGAKTIEVEVFNRWGERLYSNPNQPNGPAAGNAWDGKYKGKLLALDTYVYSIKVTLYEQLDGKDRVETLSGTITIMQ